MSLLAVHSVSHATMTGYTMAKVLDIECSLESRCKEPSEWRDKRRETRHHQAVELVGSVRDVGNCQTKLREKGVKALLLQTVTLRTTLESTS